MDYVGHVAAAPGPLACPDRGARPPIACPSRSARGPLACPSRSARPRKAMGPNLTLNKYTNLLGKNC